ncbi:hypothetical protein [Streptomyces sp. NPDC004728]|uniref:hypothetical protein n=1 Tax=Streptomyces sp. NPDC004728 TaxID=3154289 RepID=UPI0033B44FD6
MHSLRGTPVTRGQANTSCDNNNASSTVRREGLVIACTDDEKNHFRTNVHVQADA